MEMNRFKPADVMASKHMHHDMLPENKVLEALVAIYPQLNYRQYNDVSIITNPTSQDAKAHLDMVKSLLYDAQHNGLEQLEQPKSFLKRAEFKIFPTYTLQSLEKKLVDNIVERGDDTNLVVMHDLLKKGSTYLLLADAYKI